MVKTKISQVGQKTMDRYILQIYQIDHHLDLCQWESEVSMKSLKFQRYPPICFRTRFLWARKVASRDPDHLCHATYGMNRCVDEDLNMYRYADEDLDMYRYVDEDLDMYMMSVN